MCDAEITSAQLHTLPGLDEGGRTNAATDRIVLRGGRVARNLATADLARPDRGVVRSLWNLPGALAARKYGATTRRGG